MPLYAAAGMKGKLIKTLTPVFEIEHEQYAMLTPQLAGISKQHMGAKIAYLSPEDEEIIAALDLLITGI